MSKLINKNEIINPITSITDEKVKTGWFCINKMDNQFTIDCRGNVIFKIGNINGITLSVGK